MNTRKLMSFAAGAAVVCVAASAHAQTITSIQFTRGAYGQGVPLAPSAVAGVDPVAYWNSSTGDRSPSGTSPTVGHGNLDGAVDYNPQETDANTIGLVNSAGAPSSVNYSVVSYGNVSSGSTFTAGPNATTNAELLGGGAGTSGIGDTGGSPAVDPVVLTLSGLTIGDSYEFLVYVNSYQPAVEASLGLTGGVTEYFLGPNGGAYEGYGLNSFQAASSTTDFVAQAGGNGTSVSTLTQYQANYVDFTGYIASTSSATITLTELGSFGGNGLFVSAANGGSTSVGISGVQILDTASVPEPATIWSAALGLLGLVGFQRRRFFKS